VEDVGVVQAVEKPSAIDVVDDARSRHRMCQKG
jgi:hypothetical protein